MEAVLVPCLRPLSSFMGDGEEKAEKEKKG